MTNPGWSHGQRGEEGGKQCAARNVRPVLNVLSREEDGIPPEERNGHRKGIVRRHPRELS